MSDRDMATETAASRQPHETTDRRAFFARALGAAALGATTLAAARPATAQTATPTPTPTPTPSPTASATSSLFDSDYLNFALNLEYLTANFLAFATTNAGLAAADISGSVGTAGAASGGRQVAFTDPFVAQYAREMAADDLAHVRFLRSALGTTLAVAQPAIDLSPAGAFTTAMRAATVTTASATFDPYGSDDNFLLAAFLFKDAAVSAYKAVAPLLSSVVLLEAAAGLLGTAAYHAATIRAALYRRGLVQGSTLIAATEQISALRDLYDGAPTDNAATGVAADGDQGIATSTDAAGDTVSNIVPANANGLVFSRVPQRSLNILYLTRAAASTGGFFPAGVNGAIKTALVTG